MDIVQGARNCGRTVRDRLCLPNTFLQIGSASLLLLLKRTTNWASAIAAFAQVLLRIKFVHTVGCAEGNGLQNERGLTVSEIQYEQVYNIHVVLMY